MERFDPTRPILTTAVLDHYSRKARETRSRYFTELVRKIFSAAGRHGRAEILPFTSKPRTGACMG